MDYSTNPIITVLPLLIGWVADLLLGDPVRMPHPIVGFGRLIAYGERRLNKGSHLVLKGGIFAACLVIMVFVLIFTISFYLCKVAQIGNILNIIFESYIVFTCLAATTLIREVIAVFHAIDKSLDDGRQQVARIVGRDTTNLTAQEVRTAALETLAENLSDGVIAPLFWFAFLGAPGMMAYKMVNTLDSMIGYHTKRYIYFGRIAAKIDDMANFLPARLTALLIIIAAWLMGKESLPSMVRFTLRYGHCHASPNSGWPEAALASILHCRFGGSHHYFGKLFFKPYIGDNHRPLATADMLIAVKINRIAEILMIIICSLILIVKY